MKTSSLMNHIREMADLFERSSIESTFIERLEYMATYNFLSIISEQALLFTAVQDTSEKKATQQAERVLAFVRERWTMVAGRQVVKLADYTGGPKFADCVIAFGPEAALIEYSEQMRPITYSAYPINHIEFSGDETVAEAVARRRQFKYNSVNREPCPVVFARYKSTAGMKSAKHFAVARQDDMAGLIKDVSKDGGWLEFENFERSRMRIVAPGGRKKVDVSCGGLSTPMSAAEALDLLNVLTTKGLSAATKALG